MKETKWFAHVQADYAISPSSVPTDPLYSKPSDVTNPGVYQWGMHAMNFAGAWARTTGHAYVGIADAPIWPYNPNNLFDFGTSSSPTIANPDLRANFRQQFAQIASSISGDWAPVGPHGQHVVGIVAAGTSSTYAPTSGSGVAGGCTNCSVVFSGRRGEVATSAAHAESVYQLVAAGAQVINVSANTPTASTTCPSGDVSATAIQHAASRDVLYVVSSGNNDGTAFSQYPANCPGALVVGAIGTKDVANPSVNWTLLYETGLRSAVVEANSVYGVVAPGKRILSTFNSSTLGYNSTAECGTASGFDQSTLGDMFGTCSGTSMAAPHVAALAGILRSARPLASEVAIQSTIRNSSSNENGEQFVRGTAQPFTQMQTYGYGLPDATLALNSLIPQNDPQNRLTPLFAMYSDARLDHFYTTVPQMGSAASLGSLPPLGNYTASSYTNIGTAISGYPQFPGTNWWQSAGAEVWIFTTPENPKSFTIPLAPLFRLSFACNHPQYSMSSAATICANNPQHTDTTYTTDQAGIDAYLNVGYRLDGIEGYIYPKSLPQPPGTVRLMRKYNSARDDHAIFPEPLLTAYTNQGYTLNSGSDWIGYVYQNTNGNVPTIQ